MGEYDDSADLEDDSEFWIRKFDFDSKEREDFLRFAKQKGYKTIREGDGTIAIHRETIEGVINELGLWIYTDTETWHFIKEEDKKKGRVYTSTKFPLEKIAEEFILESLNPRFVNLKHNNS